MVRKCYGLRSRVFLHHRFTDLENMGSLWPHRTGLREFVRTTEVPLQKASSRDTQIYAGGMSEGERYSVPTVTWASHSKSWWLFHYTARPVDSCSTGQLWPLELQQEDNNLDKSVNGPGLSYLQRLSTVFQNSKSPWIFGWLRNLRVVAFFSF